MTMPGLFYALFLSCIVLVTCQTFNVFKSYKDAKVKPKNYAKQIQTEHPAEDYLDETQMKMLSMRNSKNVPASAAISDNWSGFKQYQQSDTGRARATSKAGYDRSNLDRRSLNEAVNIRRDSGHARKMSSNRATTKIFPPTNDFNTMQSSSTYFTRKSLLLMAFISYMFIVLVMIGTGVLCLLYNGKDLVADETASAKELPKKEILLKDLAAMSEAEIRAQREADSSQI